VSLRYLLDTNVISDGGRPTPNLNLRRRYVRHLSDLAISAVTLAEVRYGVLSMPPGRRRDELANYYAAVLPPIPVLPFDEAAAEWHAATRARLKLADIPALFPDVQIAAIAASNNLIVVTANVRDFSRLGVAFEDWSQG